jgi:hypothetical protein
MITPELLKKSEQLFLAAHALQVTWTEIVNLKEALDSALTNELGGGKTFSTINCEEEGPEGEDRDCWSYEFNFEAYNRRTQRRAAVLGFEFRLCWPPENHIKRADGSEFKLPLIVVKGTSDPNQGFGCFDILYRPDERRDPAVVDYEVHDRLLWTSTDRYWYFVFAVPLLSIVDKECVKNELVLPCSTIVKAKADADPAALEKLAFASSNHTLRWIEDANKDVVLAQPGS